MDSRLALPWYRQRMPAVLPTTSERLLFEDKEQSKKIVGRVSSFVKSHQRVERDGIGSVQDAGREGVRHEWLQYRTRHSRRMGQFARGEHNGQEHR